MDLATILKEAGPFTAPLCACMGYALHWMNQERKLALERAITAEKDAKELREKRTEDLVAMGREYAEIREAMNNVMREWTGEVRAALAALRGGSTS